MEVIVFTKDLVPIGALDSFTSLMWNDCYWETGKFEINCPLTDITKRLLVEDEDRVIWIKGERTAGIIEDVKKSIDENGEGKLTAKGNFLDILYNRRIVWGTLIFTNYHVSNILKSLITSQFITPSNPNRVMPYIQVDPTDIGTESVTYQVTGSEVLSEIISFTQAYQYGFETLFNPLSKTLTFIVYQGVNRTSSQSINKRILFSTKLDELLSGEYSFSNETTKNVGYIMGAGEGAARKSASIDSGVSGWGRRELFVDARDLSETDPDGVVISDPDYQLMLNERGSSKLGENQDIKSYEVGVRVVGSHYKYGVDFYKGDIVTVVDERLGITIDARVTGVNKAWSDDGYQLSYVFGYLQPTISQLLKRGIK